MLATAAATALLGAASIAQAQRTFASCPAAVAYVQSAPEVGDLRYDIAYGYDRTARVRNGRAEYGIRFVIRDAVVTLPDWTWQKASDADRVMLAQFRQNVLEHEAGHWRIATAFAAAVPRGVLLPATTTRAQAARYFKAFFESRIAALRKKQDAYDELTEHGRRQDRLAATESESADTIFACAPPPAKGGT